MIDMSLKLQPVSQHPFNAETPMAVLGFDLTPTDLFYVRNHFDVPNLDTDQFTLTVNGAVANPLELTLEKLNEFPERDLLVVMECAGNGRAGMKPAIKGTPWNLGAISQASFTGTSLGNILESAAYLKNVIEVRFTGSDQGVIRTGEVERYVRSLPLEVALHPDTLLVWEMNGDPLSEQHGYPLRLIVPGWYGMASVKWLEEITVLTEPFEGFFQAKEYVYLGEEGIADNTPVTSMQVRSLILEPEDHLEISMDTIQVSGIAWTGIGEITKVELSFDQGRQWIETIIDQPTSLYGTYRWKHLWRPEKPGQYTIAARAYDSEGNVQPLNSRWNKGGYGNNSSQQITVTII